MFDYVVANLPWNRNTFEYRSSSDNSIHDDDDTEDSSCINSAIIRAMASVPKSGAPVAIISGHDDGDEKEISVGGSGALPFKAITCLQGLGFPILGQATIPLRGFDLPVSGKKKSKTRSDSGSSSNGKSEGRSSDCIITLAIAPPPPFVGASHHHIADPTGAKTT